MIAWDESLPFIEPMRPRHDRKMKGEPRGRKRVRVVVSVEGRQRRWERERAEMRARLIAEGVEVVSRG